MYKVVDGIVPRDIASIYFLVDIHCKNYYKDKRIFTTNKCGYTLFNIMQSFDDGFSIEQLFEVFIKEIIDYQEAMRESIITDINNYLNELLNLGYILEE